MKAILVRAAIGAFSASIAAAALFGGCSSGETGPIGSGGSDFGTGGTSSPSTGGKGGTGGTGGGLVSSSSSSSASSSSSSGSGGSGGAGGAGGTGGTGGVVAPVCAALTPSADYPAEVEPNDTPDSANVFTSGTKGFTAGLCPVADNDIFAVDVAGGSSLSAAVSRDGTGCPRPGAIMLVVLDANGMTLASDIESGGCPSITPATTPEMKGLAAGRYFVRVRNISASSIDQYQIDLSTKAPTPTARSPAASSATTATSSTATAARRRASSSAATGSTRPRPTTRRRPATASTASTARSDRSPRSATSTTSRSRSRPAARSWPG
jgi:hypothetical protein